MGIGERESRRGWGQQLVVRGQLHSPMGKLVMRVAHVAPIRAWCFNSKRTSFHVALELEHVESVDLRSEVRKADAVLPAFAREGQRGHTLKRVARRGGCRLLFRLGVQHISIATWTGAVDVRRVAPERRANVLLFEPRAYAQAIGVPRAVRKPRRPRSKRGFEGKGYAASSVVISPNSSQIAKFAMAAAALWPLSGLSLWNARVRAHAQCPLHGL